ncbi:unnamed protein product [Adineta ricciae]|uniref:Uncharacterized protein n=1 Tax=Adineta ricciae TaxID=249248 RepID=A0A815JUT0_ADIRI|nr:unnamed protein product [Adineta ricciae]CAF1443658.1 unnamed protein product [Adineta ricciae]
MIYSSITRHCILFFANINQGQLRLMTTNTNTNVYSFNNRSSINITSITSMNETVYGIWNTTAGSDSLSEYSGYQPGSYWPGESAKNVLDGNLTTDFTSHGVCNSTLFLLTCGENTGFYFKFRYTSMILVGFRLSTSLWYLMRDPLTVTIEGSNFNGSALTLGSSWTLIYNGPSGLLSNPGRGQWGTFQALSGPFIGFSSFRFLVTSKRGVYPAVGYSEVQFYHF